MLSMVNQEDIAYLEMREILNIHNKSILTNLLRKIYIIQCLLKKTHTPENKIYSLIIDLIIKNWKFCRTTCLNRCCFNLLCPEKNI